MHAKSEEKKISTYIIIDNIRSAYNVGSIFRTSDGVGGVKILICGISPTPENPKVKKTSLRSELSVPWEYFETVEEAIKTLKELKVPIYAIERAKDAMIYNQISYPPRVGIILGNEKTGISKKILNQVDKVVEIPMHGMKKSLNVAVCAGIILYELNNRPIWD